MVLPQGLSRFGGAGLALDPTLAFFPSTDWSPVCRSVLLRLAGAYPLARRQIRIVVGRSNPDEVSLGYVVA